MSVVHLERVDSDTANDEPQGYAVLQQRPEWLAFIRDAQGAEPIVAQVMVDGVPVGVFHGAVVRVGIVRVLGSPLPGWTTMYLGFRLDRPDIDATALLRALRRFAWHNLGCVHLEMTDRSVDRDAYAAAGFRTKPADHTSWEVDLRPDEEALWMGLKPSCRRAIRKARKEGLTIEEAEPSDAFVDEYVMQMHDVFSRQGLAPTYGRDRVDHLLRHLMPTGHLLLLRVRDADGRSIATGIFPWGYGAAYFWGGYSRHDALHLRPNDLIHWEAMTRAKALGCVRYDLCGRGAYKAKFGARQINVPHARLSRYPLMDTARNIRAWLFARRQRRR